MSDRAKRIEEAARALLDGSEGIKLNAGTAEVMNYWNRYRGLRADLRAALSLPPDAPALRSHRCIDDGGDGYECPGCHARADAPDAPADYDRSIHGNPDARAWAALFAKHYSSPPEDVMIGWFANAMMAMHDHLKRRDAPDASSWATEEARALGYFRDLQRGMVAARDGAQPPPPDPQDTPTTRPWKDASPDFQAGYRAGWADREGDFLCAVDRIAPPPSAMTPDEYRRAPPKEKP